MFLLELPMADSILFDSRDRKSTIEFLEKVLDMSPSLHTEVVLRGGGSSLTRFARNEIHQNVSESDSTLSIRLIEDGHIGSATINCLDGKKIRRTLDWIHDVVRSGRLQAEPASFADPSDYESIENHFNATAELSPQERAGMAGSLIGECAGKGAEAAGAVSNEETILAIANSNGLRAYHALTDANFTATASIDGSTGWCNCYATDASMLDAESMGRLALDRALAGRNPRKVDPGKYTVILEEAAVKDFLDFLCWLGFGAQAFEDGRSFMCDKIGKKITGANITIVDDAFDSRGAGVPFDYEGVPKEQVVLIEDGIAREVVYDRMYAFRAGRSSTGHALPAGFTYGALPLDMVMRPGEADTSQMIRSIKRGLLVSRFWYCRVVDPAKTLLTGQTRDGTFLIEDGEIVGGVNDMRFNENILEAFSRAEMISKDVRRIDSTLAPAMKIVDFRFTEAVGEQ
jgi:PmbA protein